jgi:allantoinase
LIDTIGTDHSPAPPELKLLETGDLSRAWGGIASLQLALPAVWTEAHRRGFTIHDLTGWMARRPAELVGLSGRKGEIAIGRDADLVVFDPEAAFTVDPTSLHHRHRATPSEGRALLGRVETTFLRGRAIYRSNAVLEPPRGQSLWSI